MSEKLLLSLVDEVESFGHGFPSSPFSCPQDLSQKTLDRLGIRAEQSYSRAIQNYCVLCRREVEANISPDVMREKEGARCHCAGFRSEDCVFFCQVDYVPLHILRALKMAVNRREDL